MTERARARVEQLVIGLRKRIIEEEGLTEKEGYFLCLQCGKNYKPMYEDKENAPRGSIYYEQHISGICSEECWDALQEE